MNHRDRRVVVLSIILLLLPAAATAQNNAKQPGEPSSQLAVALADRSHAGDAPHERLADPTDPLWKAYNAAVEHVSVWRNEDVRKLKTPSVSSDGTVEVATATKHDVTTPLYGDTWVTIVPELLTICRQFTGNVALQVREVLGLPPDHEIPTIVVMKVQSTDLFRPTPDPTPWTLCPCGDPAGNECNFDPQVQCGNRFPGPILAIPTTGSRAPTRTARLNTSFGKAPTSRISKSFQPKIIASPDGSTEDAQGIGEVRLARRSLPRPVHSFP